MTYGYHGDDGHSFCSSGTGQPYGPTFTTGDVIGCCVNLIDCTCFYTKNGISLGIAFRELPSYLYPTVGLQTPGEVIEANFGQSPFVYDIEDYIKVLLTEWHMKTRQTVERFPIPERMGEWQTMLHKIVSTYLVHHGYCATAESFARNTDQGFEEELKSIKNRQRIQKLVLAGRMGEAIETTQQLYPGLLERDTNLLFMLKCRQFIEMVNGTDSEVRGTAIHSPKSHHGSSNSGTGSNRSTPSVSPMHYSASMPVGTSSQHVVPVARCSSPSGHIITKGHSASHISTQQNAAIDLRTISEEEMNMTNCVRNGDGDTANGANVRLEDIDVDMDTSESISDERTINSNGTMNGACTNGTSVEGSHQDDMEVDPPVSRRQLCGGIPAAVQKMLQFGRQLHSMGEQLKREFGTNNANKKALLDAFSLLAYADPWSSPVGHQLDPVEREPVCAALNSAILESHGLPKQPPLELAIGQASACMQLMSKANIGSCAFISVNTYLQH
ncbi:hypothetical protein NP493_106g07006 [Ridgeia piscesae]|uniref:Ran-binding protein 9 n=1 Tax=Ridgeia piscesae TaxID=27915 RepID=A0AAD9UHE2_RIDPI|nr:hypothetical protein NP493_106g07006 [Ridgeia piscesae]